MPAATALSSVAAVAVGDYDGEDAVAAAVAAANSVPHSCDSRKKPMRSSMTTMMAQNLPRSVTLNCGLRACGSSLYRSCVAIANSCDRSNCKRKSSLVK